MIDVLVLRRRQHLYHKLFWLGMFHCFCSPFARALSIGSIGLRELGKQLGCGVLNSSKTNPISLFRIKAWLPHFHDWKSRMKFQPHAGSQTIVCFTGTLLHGMRQQV